MHIYNIYSIIELMYIISNLLDIYNFSMRGNALKCNDSESTKCYAQKRTLMF